MNLDIMRGVVSIVLRQRGNRLDCVTPSSVAAGLAGIALLPSILGDLSYMSPVVPVTVGLLDERGLDALQDFAAAVFKPLHERIKTNPILQYQPARIPPAPIEPMGVEAKNEDK